MKKEKKISAIIILVFIVVAYIIYRVSLNEGSPFSFEPMENKLYEPKGGKK